jgi:hypothetical protein
LSYYIAHEVTHHMTSTSLGRWQYFLLPAWVREGYADYVGRAEPVDLREGALRLAAGAPEMEPKRSGLYLRYRLETAYLLQHEHQSVAELFAAPPSSQAVDQAILDTYGTH